MTIGLVKGNSIVSIMEETTEGTFEVAGSVNAYIQPLEDGLSISPSRELVERNILDASIGKATPRMGMKSVEVSIPVEMRASGTEGGDVDFSVLLEGALGAKRSITTNNTTKTGNSSTVLQIEDADIGEFSVGDIVLVKESGEHEARPISAKSTGAGTATITFPFALTGGAPANGVVVSKSQMFYTANSGHPAISVAAYWGNEVRECAVGCKVTSMALENWTPGQLASWTFGLEGMSYDHDDGAAPHTPSYDSGLPPIVLSACVWRDGVKITLNNFSMSLQNTLGFLTSTCSANGKVSSSVVQREITGSINPYKDDTSVDYYDDWTAGTEFSLFATAYTPSSTTGEITMGSVVAIWLPQCIATEFKVGDVDGILTDEIGFRATRGSAGTSEELYIGLI